MNDSINVSNALKVDIKVGGSGPLAWLINKVITLKQWCRPVHWAITALPKWVTPNGVTVFRGLLAVPVVALICLGHNWPALALAAISLVLDFVDGALAEIRNERTALGTILDPIVDKVTVVLVLGALLFSQPPLYATLAMAAMMAIEVGIQAARLRRMANWQRSGTATSQAQHAAAKWPGKMKMVCESLALIVLVLAPLFPAMLWPIGSALLVPAIVFGVFSALSQLRD